LRGVKVMVKLEELTWREVAELDRRRCVVVVPVGSFEQHGFHLPLITDTAIPYRISLLASERSRNVKLIVVPPITYGCSEHYMKFDGTITVTPDTLRSLVRDVCLSLIHHGFKKLIVLNGHGGNYAALQIAIRDVRKKYSDAVIALVNWWDLVADVIRRVRESSVMHHADEIETSVSLALGLRVLMAEARDYIPKPFSDYYTLDIVSPPPKLMVYGWLKRGDVGVIGEASKASREKGEVIVGALVFRLIDLAERLASI